ncbi:MAG: MBL fold metallo-hydrolase [Chloroflexales bacterium]|nr:MBL fold metallo-hydrolase [Chloroflexales bacterium]
MPDIQYLGHACFRIRGRDGVVDIGSPTASIMTISHQPPDHANMAAVRPLKETLNTFDGPGEYEVSGILVTGVRTFHDKKKGAERGRNTVFVLHLDDMSFAHLGDLGHELTAAQVEEMGDIDVLFIPVGGNESLTASEAVAVIAQLEPRIVIPMHYAGEQAIIDQPLDSIDKFLNEMGIREPVYEDKLSVTSTSLPAEGGAARVVLLRPITIA